MITPAPGSTLTTRSVTFSWSAGQVKTYQLWVGTSTGGYNIFKSPKLTGHSVTVPNVPMTAMTGAYIHVRLLSLVGAKWQWNDYTYTVSTIIRPRF